MAGGYTVPPDGELGVLVQRMTDYERRLQELERPTGTQTAEALQVLDEAVQDLVDRAVRSAVTSATLSVNVPTGDQSTIQWDAATSPSVSFTTPSSFVLVTIGCFATANGINTSDFVQAHLGLSLNGATPSTDAEAWPFVSSQNPFAGSSYSLNLSLSGVYAVTPNVSQTVNLRYGYTRLGGVAGATTVDFSGRYVSVIPIAP